MQTPSEPRVPRPLGVTIVALLYFLGAFLFLLVLVVPILRPGIVPALSNHNLQQDIQHAQTYRQIHVLLILIFAAIGLGLWFLQSWARYTVLVFAGADFIFRCLGVVVIFLAHIVKYHRSPGGFFWFDLIINGTIFLYLRQARVKLAFRRSAA